MPLPDESKGHSARDLIAKFQSSINVSKSGSSSGSSDGTHTPHDSGGPRPRSSFGSADGSRRAWSPRPSFDGSTTAGHDAHGRSPGTSAIGSPSSVSPANEKRAFLTIPGQATVHPGSNGNQDSDTTTTTRDAEAAASAGPASQPQPSTSDLSFGSKVASQPTDTLRRAAALGQRDAGHLSEARAQQERVRPSPTNAQREQVSSDDKQGDVKPPTPGSERTRKVSSTSGGSAGRAVPKTPEKPLDPSGLMQPVRAKTKTAEGGPEARSLSSSAARKVISPNPERESSVGSPAATTSSTAAARARQTSGPSPSSSRLMQSTAASRARSSTGSSQPGTNDAAATSSLRSSVSAGTPRRPATSMATSTTPRSTQAKARSPTNPEDGRSPPIRTTSQHSQTSAGRSRSSLAMAKEASRDTPTKGPRDTSTSGAVTTTPFRVKGPASAPSSASQSNKSGFATTPSSATVSRLTRPTASSLAHARAPISPPPTTTSSSSASPRQTPRTPAASVSPTTRSTPGSSAKATLGQRVPSSRAQGSPLAGVRGGPKIGVTVGPKQFLLQGSPANESKSKIGKTPNSSAQETTPAQEQGRDDLIQLSEATAKAQDTSAPDTKPDFEDIPEIPAASQADTQLQSSTAVTQAALTDAAETDRPGELTSDTQSSERSQTSIGQPKIVEPTAEGDEQSVGSLKEQKVFTGFGADRPVGKIGLVVSHSPAEVPSETGGPPAPSPPTSSDYAGKWGTREGSSPAPSPRAVSPAMSPNASSAEGTQEAAKKVPIWMKKGGE